MTSFEREGLLFACLLSLLLLPLDLQAGIKGMPEGNPRVRVGDRSPLESEALRTAHEQGKAILLMFGNPWHCIYCEKVWFNIKDLMPGYENDLAFILVAPQKLKFWEPPNGDLELARHYGVVGEPWVFLIDKEGIVRHIFVGFTGKSKIETEIKKVLERKE